MILIRLLVVNVILLLYLLLIFDNTEIKIKI